MKQPPHETLDLLFMTDCKSRLSIPLPDGKYILTLIILHLQYPVLAHTHSTSATSLILKIISDNSLQFKLMKLKDICNDMSYIVAALHHYCLDLMEKLIVR